MITFQKATLILLSIFATFACAEESDRPSRERIINYYEINGVIDSIDRNIESMIRESRKVYAGYPAEFWSNHDALFQEYRQGLLNAYVSVAEEHISDEELDLMFEFMETELGKKFLELNLRLGPLYDDGVAEIYGKFMDELTELVVAHAP